MLLGGLSSLSVAPPPRGRVETTTGPLGSSLGGHTGREFDAQWTVLGPTLVVHN